MHVLILLDALRKAGGDIDRAKRAIAARIGGHSANDQQSQQQRVPPRHSTAINNLSDRQYCCVWNVEVYEDGFRPDIARTLLATVARHVNPILRERGWRVKRLIESASTKWIGLCTGNGRDDADAASVNIQLNLRVEPSKYCRQFRPFKSILAVMLHEITHVSIGLEDIHPPAFYELLDEIKAQYREKLLAGEVDAENEKDDYGTNGKYITGDGQIGSVAQSAADVLGINGAGADLGLHVLGSAGSEGDCGASKKRGRGRRDGGRRGAGYSKGYTSNVPSNEKKRPLLKGAKMVDKRTKVGKAAMRERENMSARDLAAKAALARFGGGGGKMGTAGVATGKPGDKICIDYSSDDDDGSNGGKIEHGAKKDDRKYSEGLSDTSSVGEEDEVEDDELIADHDQGCGCRCCHWSKMFFLSEDKG